MAAEVSPFRAGATRKQQLSALEPILASLRDQIAAEIRDEHAEEMAVLRSQFAALVNRKIEVAAPPPANVSVSPQINVPEQAPPDVEVEVDLKEILPVLKEIRDQLKKAQVRTVERDGDGRITKITDRRT